jgi:GAF domain-containing protein
MPAERRLATLVAWTQVVLATAHDDVIDLLDQLAGTVLVRVERQRKQARWRTLGDLDTAAVQLQTACQIVLDAVHADADVRTAIFARIPRPTLETAVTTVITLAHPPADDAAARLLTRYSHLRRFLPTLLRTITFAGTASAQPVLAAVRFLQESEGRPRLDPAKLPPCRRDPCLAFIGSWCWHPTVGEPARLHLLRAGSTAGRLAPAGHLHHAELPLG